MSPFPSFGLVWRKLRTLVRTPDVLWTGILAVLSLALHGATFLFHGATPLGYDTGFYRRYLIEPITSFPNPPVPGLGDDALVVRGVLDLLRLTGLSADVILYGFYILCFAALPVLLYVLLRARLGARGAFIAGLFLIFSSVLYNAYWYMLLKNAWALALLLLALIALERRWMIGLFLLDILIAASHKTTGIIYLTTLCILMLLSRTRRASLVLHALLTGSVLLLLNLPSVREASVVLPSAIFLNWTEYLTLALPLILLAVVSVPRLLNTYPPLPYIAFAVASFAFPVLHLPFYERIFAYCDVALAGFAAYGVERLISEAESTRVKMRYGSIGFLCIACGLLFGSLWNQFVTLAPLVTSSDIAAIERIGALVPSDALLLTTSDEAPWYEGYTHGHIAAPGLLHDSHNLETWMNVWNGTSTENQISFLASFPKPLYISTLGPYKNLIGTPPACLKEIAPNLLRDDCP